jgi:hypothetical protein
MTTTTSARPLRRAPLPRVETAAFARHQHWYWLAAGLVLFFLIPFALTDLVSTNRDLYYGIYIGAVFGFVGLWLHYANESARTVLTRNWRAGVTLGVVFCGAMLAIVLNEPATSHPDGLAFAAAIVWRGVLYGLADGLILSAFPILAVFAAFAGTRALARWRGKIAVGALALAVSLLFTAVYHLGYSDFRGEKVRKPITGDFVWSVPTLATLSPLGAPITHAGLHVSAVVHSYDTDLFLPPHAAAGLDPAPLERVLEQAVSGAAGVANVATGEPMKPDARMRLETVSKIYTAWQRSTASRERR